MFIIKEIINVHIADGKKHLPTGVENKIVSFNALLEPILVDRPADGQNGLPGPDFAAGISVADTAGHFTSSPKNVEKILAELFTFASDGKLLIATAVTGKDGLPHTNDTFTQLATAIDNLAMGIDHYIVRDITMDTLSYGFNNNYSMLDDYPDIYVSGRILINESDTLSYDAMSVYSIDDLAPDITLV